MVHTRKLSVNSLQFLPLATDMANLEILSIVFVMNVSSPSCGKWKGYDILCRGNIVIKYLHDVCYIPPTRKPYEQNYRY